MASLFGVEVGAAADGSVTIRFEGELDLAVAPELRDVLVAAGSGGRVVRCDLTDVRFIDSSGLAVFLIYGRELATAGGRLRLEARSPQVERVLEIAGVATTNVCFDVVHFDDEI